MSGLFKRGDHIHFTCLKKYIIYNAVIINDIYMKGKGYFYEIIYQELPSREKDKINSNTSFKRTWYIYKNIDHENIPVPFINRGRKWLNLSKNLELNPYYYKEVDYLKRKYNYTI